VVRLYTAALLWEKVRLSALQGGQEDCPPEEFVRTLDRILSARVVTAR
jgi:hypothetical protein